MSSPLRDARLLAASHGFTQVIDRGSSHIRTKNPNTGKCRLVVLPFNSCLYGSNLETDTAWTPGIAPWDFRIVKALYNAYALSRFNNGQIIKWVDPSSGKHVAFQPMGLNWTNTKNQIQQVSMPQAVTAQVSDDILYWPSAYGAGIDFREQASPLKLNKQLIISSPSSLPSTSYDTLELNFTIVFSDNVDVMYDVGSGYFAWDKSSTIDTSKAITFQIPSGAALWSFSVPRAWDSVGNEVSGTMRLKAQGKKYYVSIRFPKAWIDSVPHNNYPIVLDPSINYQVCGNDQQGYWISSSFSVGATQNVGNNYGVIKSFAWWDGVTIPDGATIDAAHVEFNYLNHSGTPGTCTIKFVDNGDPGVITGIADGDGRTLTTASVSWVPGTSAGWNSTPDLKTIITELMDYSFASGAAMQILITGPSGTSSSNLAIYKTYEYPGNVSGAVLYIDYTEAAGASSWAGTWGG